MNLHEVLSEQGIDASDLNDHYSAKLAAGDVVEVEDRLGVTRFCPRALLEEEPRIGEGATPEDVIPHWEEEPDIFNADYFLWASQPLVRKLSEDSWQQTTLLGETEELVFFPDQFGVVPDDENLAAGHVLITPKIYPMTSFAEAALDPQIKEETEWLNNVAAEILFDGGKVIKAEHGMCGCATAQQSHIHWVRLPDSTNEDQLEEAINTVNARRGIGVEISYKGDTFKEPHDVQTILQNLKMSQALGEKTVLLHTGAPVPISKLEMSEPFTTEDLVNNTAVDPYDFPNNVKILSGLGKDDEPAAAGYLAKVDTDIKVGGLITLGEKWRNKTLPTGSTIRPYVWMEGLGSRTSFVHRDKHPDGKGFQSQWLGAVVHEVLLMHDGKLREREEQADKMQDFGSNDPRLWDRRWRPDRKGMFRTFEALTPRVATLAAAALYSESRGETTHGFRPGVLPPQSRIPLVSFG